MKTRITQIILTMATLAVFSTLSADVLAQGSSVASMTIRATVVESASLQAVNDLRFSDGTYDNQRYVSVTDRNAEFVLSGTTDAEISVSVVATEQDEAEGSNVLFTPSLVSGNDYLSSQQMIQLKAGAQGGQARASVWVEGRLESENEQAVQQYTGQYLVSAVYN
ncbi:MAG: hypothetical protein HLUCCA01_06910 [Bacteroidetes bacterium HLUCCA01]|nr:MAG: hypothetical protein HLUCCA01_06910 [Bacteroidetes bacterium HLUCCA01]